MNTYMNVKKYIKIVFLTVVIGSILLLAFYAANLLFGGGDSASVFSSHNKEKQVNVLIMATDKGGLLTDTMMIASFDKERNLLHMLSLPRDTKITIGNQTQKLNAAYAFGKQGKRHELAIQKVNTLVDLKIHYYLVLNPEGFVKVIDMLGGVEIDVPQRMEYKDPEQDLYIDLYPGKQVLNGDKAEQFCRFRKGYADQDLGRQKAQQQFVKALVEQKLKPRYLLKAPQIYKEAVKYIDTNITIGDVTTLLPLLRAFKPENMSSYQLPGSTTNGGTYFICDKAATKKLIDETFLNLSPNQ